MAGYEHILQTYDAVSVKSAQMVDAAKQGDWDRLIALEKDCSAIIAMLQQVDAGTPRPDAGYVQRKATLIRRILADDAQVRRYTEPWMEQLRLLLGSTRQERRLHQAYESGSS